MAGIYKRGRAVTAIRLGTHHVTRVFLGDKLVWDGTVSQIVTVTRARSAGKAFVPGMRADAATVAKKAQGYGHAHNVLAASAGSTVTPPRASLVESGHVPVVTADANVFVSRAAWSGSAIAPANVGFLSDGTILAGRAASAWVARPPELLAEAFPEPVSQSRGFGQAYAPTVTGGAEVTPTRADSSLAGHRPVVSGEGLRVPRAAGVWRVHQPMVSVAPYPSNATFPGDGVFPGGEQTSWSANTAADRAVGTWQARPPTVQALPGVVPTYVGALAASTTTASLSAVPPSGVQAGDLLVWIITTWDATIPTVLSGWTLSAATDGSGGVSSRTYVYSRRAVDGGTAGAAALSNAPSGGEHLGTVVAVRGSLGV
ncbi:hypothetical protein G4X40_20085, partial [Rhodococcus sp. D2-41]|uniref:hypothetical protein n=1 Tax=Speluncibacter jeojiensis TaxID=2710754 RepID=UPI002410688D